MHRISIRKIQPKDNDQIKRIIRTVMPEFGAAREGFAIYDREVEAMYEAYQDPKSAYFVCEVNGKVVGGGGVGPLQGGPDNICELKKMYFLTEARGKGYGLLLLDACLREAKEIGFTQCYLETFNTMTNAMKLYEKKGFKKIPGALGNTGHFACDTFYLLDLQ